MEVNVDGKAGFPFDKETDTVFDVVVDIGKKLQEQGRSIMSVQIDGRQVSAEDLVDTMREKPVGEIQSILITSADTQALVQESLDEIERTLPELPRACQELARVFQSETPNAGYEPFQRLAAIWSIIKERELMVANALEIPLEGLKVEEQTVKEFHNDLNGYLKEATEALKTGDSVLLGDLLEYELAPRAEKEIAIVALLKKEAGQQAG